jgi:hypothetical protein
VSAINNNKIKSRRYAFRNETAVAALAIAIGFGAVLSIHAQEIKQAIKLAAATPTVTVPEIVVTAPKQNRRSPGRNAPPAPVLSQPIWNRRKPRPARGPAPTARWCRWRQL